MKKLLSLLLAFLPLTAYCGDKDNLIGNWKEISRTPNEGRPVAFTDTIKIEFLRGNEYIWQKSGGFIYKGTYKINDKELDMGARYFTIVSWNNNSLKIKDESATYELVPFTPGPGQTVLPPEKPAAPVRNIEQMVGKWEVFKGTTNKTIPVVDYTRKIKSVTVTGNSGEGKLGEIFASNDGPTPSWYIESYSNQTLYCNGKDNRILKVLKCEDNELIIEEGGMTYFLRKFKK